jgi:hypothetical protein
MTIARLLLLYSTYVQVTRRCSAQTMYTGCLKKYLKYKRGPKKCTHSLIVNIFGTKWSVVTILARYCSVMFAPVSRVSRVTITRWCSASLPSTCQGVLGWQSTWTMDRSKKCYWIPTTVSRPKTSRLLPLGNLEGWSLSTKASHTERATRNRRSVWWSLRTDIMTHSPSAQEL